MNAPHGSYDAGDRRTTEWSNETGIGDISAASVWSIAAKIKVDDVALDAVKDEIHRRKTLLDIASVMYGDILGRLNSMRDAATHETVVEAFLPGQSRHEFLHAVEMAISRAKTEAARVAGYKALLDSQEEFVQVLSSSLSADVSAFVDTDMNVAWTRLEALQSQQQLCGNSLSIANRRREALAALLQ